MYDLDALDYTVGGDKHLSSLEKTKAYVGEGKDDIIISIFRALFKLFVLFGLVTAILLKTQ